MKTDELIALIAADARPSLSLGQRLAIGYLAGILGASALLLATLGLRPDLVSAMGTPRVAFKLVETLLLALTAAPLLFGVGRPDRPLAGRALLLLAPLLGLAAAVGVELFVLPEASWRAQLVGRHAGFCLVFVPLLSILPAIGFFLALRHGAPNNPGLAGAVAGLAAGAVGAAVYAWHCPDDSPLFVAAWYGAALALVTGVGALIGRRLLRW